MLVVGLHGWILPPPAILFCDLFVYSEFMIHPLLLLLASKRLRKEILKGCKARILVSFTVIFIKLSITFHLVPLVEFIINLIFQNLIKTSEEIIFLSKRKLLRVKRKKIVENSTKTSTNSAPANTGTTTNTSPEDDSRLSPPGDLPLQETPPWVPITFSWPSLEVESVSVHNQEEILDQRPYQVNFNVGLKQNFNRISSACDSGYSELDISSTATQENNTMNVVKEEPINNCDKSYLDEFQLYFNLDKMLDRTSHEDHCFKELGKGSLYFPWKKFGLF